MGAVMTTFGKDKLKSYEVLEKLEKDIAATEEHIKISEQRKDTIIQNLLSVTIVLCSLSCIMIYIYFSPESWSNFSLYISPLLILFPMMMLGAKRGIYMYYGKKLERLSRHLLELQAEKRKVLDEVMERETYKTARCLLERFSDGPLSAKGSATCAPPVQSAVSLQSVPSKEVELASTSCGLIRRTTSNPIPATRPAPSDFPGRALPRPILSMDRTFLDKLVDFIANDGPQNRYAMICRQCHSHNGMALKEEFEYLAYRCAFCGVFNPARKFKPMAPGLGVPFPPERVITPQLVANAPPAIAETAHNAATDEDPGGNENAPGREKVD